MKRANVFHRLQTYFVSGMSQTPAGLWVASGAVPSAQDEATLGRSLLSVLDETPPFVSHPTDWRAVLRPLLMASDTKSWAAFARSATCLDVEETGGRITLTPTRNLGPARGFEPESSLAVVVIRESPEQLGALVADLLRKT